jgi:hypothetical protein
MSIEDWGLRSSSLDFGKSLIIRLKEIWSSSTYNLESRW